MQTAKDMQEYQAQIKEALDEEFQRKALDKFASAYPSSREKAFADFDLEQLINEIAASKDKSIAALEDLYAQFKENAEKAGAKVHYAANAREANEIITDIAKQNQCLRIVKSKSMTAEETLLNHHLEEHGLEVTETDLGEWIIQLRNEGPTHMVMPAIHLSKEQVGDLFTRVTGQSQENEIEKLVKVARRELRQRFVQADMGISGANFALADSGTLGIVTNEGNGRLVTTLPRVHVALLGLDKLVFSLKDALRNLKGLTRNATAQAITSYVTWITGATQCAAASDGQKQLHIVFLDNGRLTLSKDPVFSQVLRCVRCGACANVCPIYRLIGGREYGHIYIGAIGLILTYFFHGRDKDRNLIQNCLNCQACKKVCIAGIDLPRLIKEVQILIQKEEKPPLMNQAASLLLTNRRLFHSLLKTARYAQYPISRGQPYIRHLPEFFLKKQNFKALPALASKPFRQKWPKLRTKLSSPKYKVALFSGCLQDFVYPEQLEAGLKILQQAGVQVEFPRAQGCCGLPVMMLGEKKAAQEVALHNLSCFEPAEYDYILTFCASCGSHLKENYPYLLQDIPGKGVKVRQFSDKVIDFSSFVYQCLSLKPEDFKSRGKKFAYHAPCHLCRGLNVQKGPRELLQAAGLTYQENAEEETCCGLGGTYSVKFPEISKEILYNKLNLIQESGAQILATDCPGCILQLRGGTEKLGKDFKVMHVAEVLAEEKKD